MGVAGRIGAALETELALPSVEDGTVIVVRLLSAAVLGALVGWERERKRRPAGLKTHVLVSIGSALFVLAPLMAGIDSADVTRVMQGIVSGIGFLGAGAIIKLDRGSASKGSPPRRGSG